MIGELAATATAVTWALAVVLFRRAGSAQAPWAVNLFKNVLALVLFVPTVWLAGGRLVPDWSANDWLLVTLSGVLGIAIGDTLFLASLNRIGAALWALVDCLYGPCTILFAVVLLGERLSALALVGGALIIAGIVLAATDRESFPKHGVPWVGMLLGALAAASMALGAVLTKPVVGHSDLVAYTTVRLAIGTAPLLLGLAHRARRRELAAAFVPSPAWKDQVPASLLSTYLGLLLWLAGLKYALVGVATLLNQLSTVIIVVFARLILGERITRRKAAAIALALAGACILMWGDLG